MKGSNFSIPYSDNLSVHAYDGCSKKEDHAYTGKSDEDSSSINSITFNMHDFSPFKRNTPFNTVYGYLSIPQGSLFIFKFYHLD